MQRGAKCFNRTLARLFLNIALFTIGIAACSRPPDEVRIRHAIESMRDAAEAKKAAGVIEPIAADFTGNSGDIDRDALRRMLQIQFLRNDAIGVDVGTIEVSIDDDRATARFDIALSDGSRRWIPGGRESYSIVSGWRREGDAWVCYNATWSVRD